MLSIGAFAQIGQVTHRQLRHWDSAGLLVPAHVDEFTGYRSYDPSQLKQLHRIVALRRLGFGIDDIAAMLDEGVDTDFLTKQLRIRQAEVEREHRVAAARLVDVERRLHLIETENHMSQIEYVEKPLPALRLAACARLRAIRGMSRTLRSFIPRGSDGLGNRAPAADRAALSLATSGSHGATTASVWRLVQNFRESVPLSSICESLTTGLPVDRAYAISRVVDSPMYPPGSTTNTASARSIFLR